jgi:hypothetical protein
VAMMRGEGVQPQVPQVTERAEWISGALTCLSGISLT